MRAFSRIIAAGLPAIALAGCLLSDRDPPAGQPSFYRSLAQPNAEIDAAAAQSMISGYRQNNGLTPVTIDPILTRMAQEQARVMAADHGRVKAVQRAGLVDPMHQRPGQGEYRQP